MLYPLPQPVCQQRLDDKRLWFLGKGVYSSDCSPRKAPTVSAGSPLTAHMDLFTCASICSTPENVVKVLISWAGYLALLKKHLLQISKMQCLCSLVDFSGFGTTLLLMLQVFIQHSLQGK